jgi:hypothetical protein
MLSPAVPLFSLISGRGALLDEEDMFDDDFGLWFPGQ